MSDCVLCVLATVLYCAVYSRHLFEALYYIVPAAFAVPYLMFARYYHEDLSVWWLYCCTLNSHFWAPFVRLNLHPVSLVDFEEGTLLGTIIRVPKL
jgi:hypothetical protein